MNWRMPLAEERLPLGACGEALVAVGIPIEDDLGVMVVKGVPEGLYLGAIVAITGSIERVLEVGQRALRLVAARSLLSQCPWAERQSHPPTSMQLLLRATMCQVPRS